MKGENSKTSHFYMETIVEKYENYKKKDPEKSRVTIVCHTISLELQPVQDVAC